MQVFKYWHYLNQNKSGCSSRLLRTCLNCVPFNDGCFSSLAKYPTFRLVSSCYTLFAFAQMQPFECALNSLIFCRIHDVFQISFSRIQHEAEC
ncbi:hypothetical protein EGR_08088 [Echinococcus granulosus]|uniref:Uncharacterized protein n=1 Tax=Echinococcus granulosus TaxID=6210 RepID=W6UUL4_ECHGR|nr:hypothetical protein EGR_08088 [Echinococcus granulosus]EUB57079.1 hypothetical protein EGR_08088 [Echinococcus granulosus]